VSHYDERLRGALSAYRAPQPLLTALAQQQAPDIVAGQVWRASLDGTVVLVLVLEAFTEGAGFVAVATPGEIPPDGSTIEHQVETTEVFRTLTVWPSLRGQLHQRVLDVMLEHSPTTTALAAQLRARMELEHEVDVTDPGAELLAELRDDFEALQHAPAVPVRREGAPKLAAVLPGGAREQLVELMAQLSVPQQQAMELLRGQRELTAEQTSTLEQAIGFAPGTLPIAGGVEAALAVEVEHPRWREAARQRAHAQGVAEVAGRISLAVDAHALAARESTATPDWRQRLALIVAGDA
jgi:hypothetical protein